MDNTDKLQFMCMRQGTGADAWFDCEGLHIISTLYKHVFGDFHYHA